MVAKGDVAAVIGLVLLGLMLFGPHVVGASTFVGNSDRLHTFLNLRQLEVDALHEIGRVPAWDASILMGSPIFGLHWILTALDPMAVLVALFPGRDLIRVSGYVSAAHLIAASLAAYLFLRDVVRSPFAAFVGAGLYVCSAFAIHRISQVDPAFSVLIVQPIGLLILRRLRPGGAALGFLGLTAIVVALLGFMFLQEVAYVLLFFGAYACYRLLIAREWRPFVVLGAAGLVGILLAAPRVGTVLEDFRELSRSSSIQVTCSCEVLRWFDDGIFGRNPNEARTLENGNINLHEGLQLYMSTMATVAVIAALVRPRGGPAVLAGAGFLLTLTALASQMVASRSGALWLLAVTAGLTVWALSRAHLGRRFRMPTSSYVQDADLRFFILFLLLTFAIVLSDGMRYLLYLIFFRVDFTHARISVAALLPLSTLAAVFVYELFGARETDQTVGVRNHVIALVAGGALAVTVVLLLDPLAPVITTAMFGSVDRVRLTPWFYVSTREVGRIVLSIAIFLVILGLNWLARHVTVSQTVGRLALAWRAGGDAREVSPIRLAPAYLLGFLMMVQAFGNAYFQLNGEHTQTYPVPFAANNNFTAPAGVLSSPSPEARQAIRDRLEVDAYRAVTVSAPDGYPTYDWYSERGYGSFVATFWRLRLANGYVVLTRRFAELPWPDGSRSLRAISFSDQRILPWSLLAILNVKYAVVASPSLIFNIPADGVSDRAEASPADLTILENPLPVLPRAFFTSAISARVPAAPSPVEAATTPPVAIRITITPNHGVLISWVGGASVASYQIHRRRLAPKPEAASSILGEIGRGGEGLLDGAVEQGALYEYRVRSCVNGICGDLSEAITARISSAGIAAPTLTSVEPQSGTEVLVTWTPGDANAGVQIEVAAANGAPVGDPIEVPAGVQSYVVGGLRPLRDYGIRVRGCSSDRCSPHTAQRVVKMPSALTAAELNGVIPADLTRESVVDGLDAPRTFGTSAGTIRATYQGDRISIELEPADSERFLVVNELYHPSWHAYALDPGRSNELKVWPTNVVMRGVLVPAGVAKVEMRYEPFMTSWPALACVIAGLFLSGICWLALRRVDRPGIRGCRADTSP